jgi:hypothetical protein
MVFAFLALATLDALVLAVPDGVGFAPATEVDKPITPMVIEPTSTSIPINEPPARHFFIRRLMRRLLLDVQVS